MSSWLTENRKIWISGRWISGTMPDCVWEFIGVFTAKYKAIEACIDDDCFIAPMFVNKSAPKESIAFPNIEWPLREVQK